jgi:hypothetical protein
LFKKTSLVGSQAIYRRAGETGNELPYYEPDAAAAAASERKSKPPTIGVTFYESDYFVGGVWDADAAAYVEPAEAAVEGGG